MMSYFTYLLKSLLISKFFFYIIIFAINGKCDDDQPIVEYYYLSDSQYVFLSQRVTWDEANMVCEMYNGRLAVLDSMKKAMSVAEAMAQSNIAMEDAWLGGRRMNFVWTWVDNINSTTKHYKIPLESDIDEFPPWSREPLRPTKECLAIDRRSHSRPNFVDLDCRLLRPFICEKKPEDSMNNPVPAKWVQINRNTFTLYHGRVTWIEAVTFCRAQGTRLAVIKNQNIINILVNSMTKSRPDFENVWIGGRFSHGQWMWISTGVTLNPIKDGAGYPPWRFGKPEKNSGCLLLDRHLENTPNFIEMLCDRKRDFVCEKYPPEELEEWTNEPIKFSYEKTIFIIYPIDKTWDESRLYCQERGSTLAYITNLLLANLMVTAMGDHPKEISHIWLGGLYQTNRTEWKWVHNDDTINSKSDDSGFPPWAESVNQVDIFGEESLCLNLDRSDHNTPHFYGLDCESKQPFACLINCAMPPSINNGKWHCNDTSKLKTCTIECDPGYFVMGLKSVSCSINDGWFNKENWLEFPLCLDSKGYLNRFIRSLGQDMQKSSGYYVMLSHLNEKIQDISFDFVEELVRSFPVSNYLKMGMTNYVTNPKSKILYTQNDTCKALELLSSMKTQFTKERINVYDANTSDYYTDWYKDILKYNEHRTIIVAIIDSAGVQQNQEIFERLRALGHYVVTVGLKDDWTSLLPITTIGYDERLNLYLLDEQEFETIVAELKKMKKRPVICTADLGSQSLSNSSEDASLPETITDLTEDETMASKEITDVSEEDLTESSRTASNININTNINKNDFTSTLTDEEKEEELESLSKAENVGEKQLSPKEEIYRRIYMDREKTRQKEKLSQNVTD